MRDDANSVDSHRSAEMADEELDLPTLRDEIARVDSRLIELVARRTDIAEAVARAKERDGIATTAERQEERVLDRAAESAAQFDLDEDAVRDIWTILIEMNKDAQRTER